MSETETVATWDILPEFGFQSYSDDSCFEPGLAFDFGNFKLSAKRFMNLQFEQVVDFYGVLSTRRTFGEVEFELPVRVASRDLCAAWITWHLDNAADGGVFIPARAVPWLAEGRKHRYLLPWEQLRLEAEREHAEWVLRPCCTVEREWLKLALKSLAKHLADVEGGEQVEIGFDGKVLSFQLSGKMMLVAATGTPWKSQFALSAETLRNLPKRLMDSVVEVSAWRANLRIGRSTYDGLVEKS